MKKYQIHIIAGNAILPYTVFAEYYHSTTTSSASSGNYAFYCDGELVACYPMERTIIVSIENAEEI
jgi:hypothetical protein